MKISVYLTDDNKEHDKVLSAFAEGLIKSGAMPPNGVKSLNDYSVDDISVVFGKEKISVHASQRRGMVIRRQKESGKKVIILEKGYIKRDKYYSAGFDDINGHADFKNNNSDSVRAGKIGVKLLPWKTDILHKDLLVIGQVPWDASVQDIDHIKWVDSTVKKLNKLYENVIVFRDHPLSGNSIKKPNGCFIANKNLDDDFKNAGVVITQNSTTGVESIIQGIPTIACDEGSMAWPIAGHNLKELKHELKDRTQWLNNLCYAQWNILEMMSGEAWEHLNA